MKVGIKHLCNDVDRVKQSSWREDCASAILSTKNLTELAWDWNWDSTTKGWRLSSSGMLQLMLFFFLTIVPYGYKSLNTTLIILCFKMYITAEWQRGMDTDSVSTLPFMFSWRQPGRHETDGFCVCKKKPNNTNELIFLYNMYLVVA
jgi:hypothetical protein